MEYLAVLLQCIAVALTHQEPRIKFSIRVTSTVSLKVKISGCNNEML